VIIFHQSNLIAPHTNKKTALYPIPTFLQRGGETKTSSSAYMQLGCSRRRNEAWGMGFLQGSTINISARTPAFFCAGESWQVYLQNHVSAWDRTSYQT
jgi:hypothetical protein